MTEAGLTGAIIASMGGGIVVLAGWATTLSMAYLSAILGGVAVGFLIIGYLIAGAGGY